MGITQISSILVIAPDAIRYSIEGTLNPLSFPGGDWIQTLLILMYPFASIINLLYFFHICSIFIWFHFLCQFSSILLIAHINSKFEEFWKLVATFQYLLSLFLLRASNFHSIYARYLWLHVFLYFISVKFLLELFDTIPKLASQSWRPPSFTFTLFTLGSLRCLIVKVPVEGLRKFLKCFIVIIFQHGFYAIFYHQS